MQSKNKLHPRNLHKDGYDFTRLVQALPELEKFTQKNPAGQTTINFQDQQAVRTLNQALLKAYYDIDFWQIPENYLCPPIPGRVDYIHYLADLLAHDNRDEIPVGRHVKILDVGTGANLVYPLTGQSAYGWHFTGTDIDPISIKTAKHLCKLNKLKINLKLQNKQTHLFKGIIDPKDIFHLTMCNPPFHASPDAASKGTQRKWKNLGKGNSSQLNFGGQSNELWCPGGEMKFIANMIRESAEFADQCLWFTSLVSKKENIKPLQKLLRQADVRDSQIINMAQGQKVSRFIAWSYFDKSQRQLFMENTL